MLVAYPNKVDTPHLGRFERYSTQVTHSEDTHPLGVAAVCSAPPYAEEKKRHFRSRVRPPFG